MRFIARGNKVYRVRDKVTGVIDDQLFHSVSGAKNSIAYERKWASNLRARGTVEVPADRPKEILEYQLVETGKVIDA